MVRFGELIVILELHQQGLSVSAIARRTGLSRGAIRKYVTRGIEPPVTAGKYFAIELLLNRPADRPWATFEPGSRVGE